MLIVRSAIVRIYHYTSIDSLALILKNRTLRFSRLDRVDDLEEARVEQNQYDLSKFLFVSCWTENGEESIPLWKMYSGGAGGVRIGVDKEMFEGFLSFSFDLGWFYPAFVVFMMVGASNALNLTSTSSIIQVTKYPPFFSSV